MVNPQRGVGSCASTNVQEKSWCIPPALGATLEWGRIEALGTVYQVEASKASELLQDLEYFDPLSNYGWLPEGVS